MAWALYVDAWTTQTALIFITYCVLNAAWIIVFCRGDTISVSVASPILIALTTVNIRPIICRVSTSSGSPHRSAPRISSITTLTWECTISCVQIISIHRADLRVLIWLGHGSLPTQLYHLPRLRIEGTNHTFTRFRNLLPQSSSGSS
jgi:hypothetical protein